MEENTMMQQCGISPQDPLSAAQAAAFVEGWLEQMETPVKAAHRLLIAVDEICSNIARYSGADSAVIRCAKDARGISLEFRDNGVPYNPLTAAEPDVASGSEEREIGGLGILMVRRLMDEVAYRREDGMNVLTIFKA